MIDPTCGCCEAGLPDTPALIENRPALSAIVFRAGTFSSFRRAMLHEISRMPELASLTTRLDEDYAITVLDLWAIVADILTFYQERIANESYLRTAKYRDSVLRLVRLLDYHLSPGVAASSYVAFTVERDRNVRIPIGLRIQSVPLQDQKPQKYETLESFQATPFWNKLRILPAPVTVNPLARGATRALLTPGSAGLAAAALLRPGGKLVLFNSTGASGLEEITVSQTRFVEERVQLTWVEPIQSNSWNFDTQVYQYQRLFRVFGHTAPAQFVRPTPPSGGALSIRWNVVNLAAAAYNISGPLLPLDGKVDNLRTGARILVAAGGIVRLFTILSVTQSLQSLGNISDTVTVLNLNGSLPSLDRRQVVVYELAAEAIRFWGLDYPDRVNASIVYIPGRRAAGDSIEVGRTAGPKGFASGVTVALSDIDKGRRVIVRDPASPAAAGKITASSLFGADVHFEPSPTDATTVLQLGFGPSMSREMTGLATAALPGIPVITNPKREIALTIGTIGPRLVSLTSASASLAALATALQTEIIAADGDPLFTKARVVVVGSRVIILPGISGAAILVRPSADDPTTAADLGFDGDRSRPVAGLISGALPVMPVLVNPARQMAAKIGAFGPRLITLSGSPVSIADAALKIQTALNSADPSPLFAAARVVAVDNRLLAFPGPVGEELQEFLRLEVSLEAGASFNATSAILYGNVAQAGHGETVANEVLGDGETSLTFQNFRLQKKPLTSVAAATESGMETSLQVLVNRVKWNEVPSLFAAGPEDAAYITRIADDGTPTITFGDGRNGARLPTGRANIVATYRQGSGVVGRVAEGQLKTLLDMPVGLKSAINPVPSDGGGDPETLEMARTSAPVTVRTFQRAVSMLDLEDLAVSRADVAKARATWVWDRDSRSIYLTVAGDEGATFSPSGLALIHASLDLMRDRNYRLTVNNYSRIPVVVYATIVIAPDRIAEDVKAAARSALLEALSFRALDLGAPIHLSDLFAVIQGVPGVLGVDIDRLHFKDQSPANLALRGATADPVQRRLVIFAARPGTAPNLALPAEQATIEMPADDVVILTTGGLPS